MGGMLIRSYRLNTDGKIRVLILYLGFSVGLFSVFEYAEAKPWFLKFEICRCSIRGTN